MPNVHFETSGTEALIIDFDRMLTGSERDLSRVKIGRLAYFA